MDPTSKHLEEFKKHLAHLESDSKYIINLLTILARDLQQDKQFVTGTVNLLILYSKEVDCDVRAKLFKLRITWLGVFSNSELHRIDLKTREIDPAWPLIAEAEDSSKDRIMSLPKIPKSKTKSDPDSEKKGVNESPFKSTSSVPVRDPRLKRKSEPDSIVGNDDNFMIDRAGQRTDSVIAKKISKKDYVESVKESQIANKPSLINHSIQKKPWSNYVSKHSELSSKEPKDIDMRIMKKQQHRDVVVVQPKVSRVDPRTKTAPIQEIKPVMKPRNPDALPGPPIRGPDWNVEIEGYPDMIQIGIDPRLLSLSYHPKPPKTMTIDRANYPLFLDRIHPLIRVNDYFHAVRFRCMSVEVLIDDVCYKIPGTGFRFIDTNFGKLMACLGGPGHELIIDGRPHTVPMSGELTYINIKGKSVGVCFVGNLPNHINVLPAIPPKILKWAAEQLFGSPNNLSKPPRNPFEQMKRLARERENQMMVPTRLPQEHIPIPGLEDPTPPNPCQANLDVNVHDLFSKLMAAGIVGKKEETPVKKEEPEIKKPSIELPSLKEYSWDKFKKMNELEVESLFFGYQCSLCGIRFENESSPEYAKHLDYHFIRNATDVNSTTQNHHSWFQQASFWLRGELCNEMGNNMDEGSESDDEKPKCVASSDPTKNICAVCRENFESYFDNEEEEWMIDNAIFIDGQYFHPICREDAGKYFDEKNTSLNETDVSIANQTSVIKADPEENESESTMVFSTEENSENTQVEESVVKVKTEEPCVKKEDSLPSYTDIVLNPLAALQNILGVDKLANKK